VIQFLLAALRMPGIKELDALLKEGETPEMPHTMRALQMVLHPGDLPPLQ